MKVEDARILIGIDKDGNPSVIKHADWPNSAFEVEVRMKRTETFEYESVYPGSEPAENSLGLADVPAGVTQAARVAVAPTEIRALLADALRTDQPVLVTGRDSLGDHYTRVHLSVTGWDTRLPWEMCVTGEATTSVRLLKFPLGGIEEVREA